MPAPEITLKLEQALQACVIASGWLPEVSAAFGIYCAHESPVIPDNQTDYLKIHASRPGGANLADGILESIVEFQLFTGGIANDGDRPAAVVNHDARAAALDLLWSEEQHAATLAVLNAPILAGIVFSGWHDPEDAPEPDQQTDRAQLYTNVRKRFVYHRA